jgi:hypothetical protein
MKYEVQQYDKKTNTVHYRIIESENSYEAKTKLEEEYPNQKVISIKIIN